MHIWTFVSEWFLTKNLVLVYGCCGTAAGSALPATLEGGVWVSAARCGCSDSHIYACLRDLLIQLKKIYGDVNYRNMIYYFLFVFIILTFIKNFSPQLSNIQQNNI